MTAPRISPSDWTPELVRLEEIATLLQTLIEKMDRVAAVWEEIAARTRGPFPPSVVSTPAASRP